METITLDYIDSTQNNEQKSISFSAHLLKEDFNTESLFVSQVNGQSMQPKIMHEALVISDLSKKQIIDKKIYLVNYDNNMWIKQASFNAKKNDFEFVSINPDYSHLVYDKDDVYVIAQALLTFTSLS